MGNEERRCAEFVRELLDLRNGLLHVDILNQNEVLELIQIAFTLWSQFLATLVIPVYFKIYVNVISTFYYFYQMCF